MKETLIDIETYCEADIKKCGLYRYVSDPSFEILLIAWATDGGEGFGETKLADLASGDPFPQELLDDFKDSNVTLMTDFAEIKSADLFVGEIVYKARKPGDSSYNLPDRYKADGGDLLDYYHVGMVKRPSSCIVGWNGGRNEQDREYRRNGRSH